MKIGIIGSGNIGGTLARLWTAAGHVVMVSNSRGPESLRDFVRELGGNAQAGTLEDAARFGEVVLLAAPWRAHDALPPAESVTGKVVIDAMNPYGDNGTIIDLGDSSSSEETAKRLPGARIVKAFNTIWVKHLEANGRADAPVDDRHVVFVAGDDAEAKRVVSRLIEEIGFGPVDTGSLRDGKRQEPNTNLYNQVITAREGRERVAAG
ncbi:MAG TPA: NADPH-dependent F420 reductase [Thermoanaerobaculia bacterium]|nr:NADPH-dependent F420 reductase [Thermoanaerobaculia bacterium]